MNTHDIELPEGSKAKEILSLVDTLIASVNGAHHAKSNEWRDGCFHAADETYQKIKTELAAIEADRKRMGESQEPFGYFRPEPFGWTDCAATDDGAIALYERPQAQGEPVANTHTDDDAVDYFAAALKEKLAQARAKGRSGWHECDPTALSAMLREHVEKGDPRDVANFCMFLWSLGQPISAAPQPAEPVTPRTQFEDAE